VSSLFDNGVARLGEGSLSDEIAEGHHPSSGTSETPGPEPGSARIHSATAWERLPDPGFSIREK
jgi:hypothetical protein